MARTKSSVDAEEVEATHAHDDDAALTVERIEFSKAYRFASARELINTEDASVTLDVKAGSYMKLIGPTNDDRVVVADRDGVEYVADTNVLDRAI